jgi:F-type H+-transporting ATPase subunit epsilon
MAEQKFLKLNIARVDGPVFTGEVVSVTVPGSEGEMTLLADHTPLVSALRVGVIIAKLGDGTTQSFDVTTGTLEVSHNTVTILI